MRRITPFVPGTSGRISVRYGIDRDRRSDILLTGDTLVAMAFSSPGTAGPARTVNGRSIGKAVLRRVVGAAATSQKLRRYVELAIQELDEAVHQDRGVSTPRTQYRMVKELADTREPFPGLRAFRVGHDEAALLRINNEAFAWHPEQGGWDARRLEQVLAEPWFDPAALLLAERDGEPIGFCWTRTTPSRPYPEGAIWVIAVSGGERRHGIGQILLAAGEAHLHRQGCRMSTLYVDASNQASLFLFIRNGYVVDRVERLYGQPPLNPPT